MKNTKKLLALLLAVGMLFTACGKAPSEEVKDPEVNPPQEQQEEQQAEETGTRIVTDMGGREVEIPVNVKSVHTTSPVGQDIMYTINPDKMAGWCTKLNERELHFIDEKYHNLPVLGGNFGKGNKMNPEVVAAAAPDIILDMGKVDDKSASGADKLQEQLGIPVLLVKTSAKDIDKCYEFLGDVLNEKEVCNKHAEYCRKVNEMVATNSAKLKEEDKVSVYYAETENGLATDPSGSSHALVLDMIGCKNVAEVETSAGYGRADVSPEQILKWNPDMIIICPEFGEGQRLYEKMASDNSEFWGDLEAVKNGNFYEVPVGPFNWFDRPPSINQILGLQWCGNLVYPELYNYDMKEVTKDFFAEFFHYELSDEEYDKLVVNSIKK